MSVVRISIEEDPAPAELQMVERGLVEHALAAGVEPRNHRGLAIVLRDPDARVVGGLVGATVWGWLHVLQLWVAEEHRREGWGTKLLHLAESEAAGRGCHHAFLDTFDFQALRFYEKLGYEVFGSLSDFPTGHLRYFIQKRLS